MHTPAASHPAHTAISDRDAHFLRCAAAMFPAAYAFVGVRYAFGLLIDGWQVLDGGTQLNMLGGLIAGVQAVAAGAVTFGIVADKQWRWRALAGWVAIFAVCGALFGMFGVLPDRLDRVRLLVMSLGGVGVTTTLAVLSLRTVERRLREGR